MSINRNFFSNIASWYNDKLSNRLKESDLEEKFQECEYNFLQQAIIQKNTELALKALKKAPHLANGCSNGGETCLHTAILHNNTTVVKKLLKNNVDVNKKFNWHKSEGRVFNNCTPLFLAVVWQQSKETTIALLQHGADPNAAITTKGSEYTVLQYHNYQSSDYIHWKCKTFCAFASTTNENVGIALARGQENEFLDFQGRDVRAITQIANAFTIRKLAFNLLGLEKGASFSFKGQIIKGEGNTFSLSSQKQIASLHSEFMPIYPLHDPEHEKELQEALDACAKSVANNKEKRDIEARQLWELIKQNRAVIIVSGYKEHCFHISFKNGYMGLCNTGFSFARAEHNYKTYKIDKNRLQVRHILEMWEASFKTKEESAAIIQSILKEVTEPFDAVCRECDSRIFFQEQKIGNCWVKSGSVSAKSVRFLQQMPLANTINRSPAQIAATILKESRDLHYFRKIKTLLDCFISGQLTDEDRAWVRRGLANVLKCLNEKSTSLHNIAKINDMLYDLKREIASRSWTQYFIDVARQEMAQESDGTTQRQARYMLQFLTQF